MISMLTYAGVGGVLGYLYYRLVGCRTGACPLTANPITSILYGALIGFLMSDFSAI